MGSDRTAWLTERRSGIGASDVAGILGLSKWASPFSVWLSKVSELSDDPSEAMEFGTRAEDMLGRWFMDRTGLWVRGEQEVCVNGDDPWMRCTVDGFVHDGPQPGDPIAVAEWKTTGDTEWPEVPVYYRTQAQWSMAVTGLPAVFFGVLHLAFGRPQFRTYEVARDDADIMFIVERCRVFWNDYVLTGTPPPVDAHPATTAALKEQWPTPEGSLQADDNARTIVARYAAAKATTKIAEETERRLGNELRALLGDKEALIDDSDRVLASFKWQPDNRLDSKALRAAHPGIADEFTTSKPKRVLRLADQGEDE